MPIFTKDGKILFVSGKVATDEACCCNAGPALFHISPDSLSSYTITDDFANILRDLATQWDVRELSTGVVTHAEGYVTFAAPTSGDEAGIRPWRHIREDNTNSIGANDDFVARVDFEQLSLPPGHYTKFTGPQFGIYMGDESPTAWQDRGYLKFNTNYGTAVWQAKGGVGGTSQGAYTHPTAGYIQISRTSGTISFIINGTTVRSEADTYASYGVPYFLLTNSFSNGSPFVKVTQTTVTINGEDVYTDAYKWTDIVSPGVNDAVYPSTPPTNFYYWPIYDPNAANDYDGVFYGGPYIHHTPQTINPGPMTVHVAFKFRKSSEQLTLFGYSLSTLNDQFIISKTADGNIRVYGSSSGDDAGEIATTNDGMTTDTVYIVSIVINGASSRIYIDNVRPTYTTTMRDAGVYQFKNPKIGGLGTGNATSFDPTIIELKVTEGAASSDDVLAIYNEWQPKYKPTP